MINEILYWYPIKILLGFFYKLKYKMSPETFPLYKLNSTFIDKTSTISIYFILFQMFYFYKMTNWIFDFF